MKIYLASDHAGFKLKEIIDDFLVSLGYDVVDCGAYQYDEGDDYPNFISKAAEKVSLNPDTSRGIIFGGSGQGEAMVANKFPSVRCTVFYGPRIALDEVDIARTTEHDPYVLMRLSREHNDANMVSIGARFVTEEEAKYAIHEWLSTSFKNEERHIRRIKQFENL